MLTYEEVQNVFLGDLTLSSRYIDYEAYHERPIRFKRFHFEKGGLREKILTLINTINDESLRDLTINLVDTPAFYLRKASYAHHTDIGGLAEHSLETAWIALGILTRVQYEVTYLSRDLLVFGGLAHDIGKLKVMSDEPKLIDDKAHQSVGANDLRHMLLGSRKFSSKQIDQLTNIILAHHEHFTGMSDICPFKTYEAYMISMCDRLSAGTSMCHESILRNPDNAIKIYTHSVDRSEFD